MWVRDLGRANGTMRADVWNSLPGEAEACANASARSQAALGRYGRTRDVPYGDHCDHCGHGGHSRRGDGLNTRWETSPITELTAQITAVTAPVTAITALITAVTAPVTVVTAQNTADTAQARRADVGTPERRRLRVPRRRSRASEAATRQTWRVVGGAGPCWQPLRRQPQGGSFHQGWAGRTKRTMQQRINDAP